MIDSGLARVASDSPWTGLPTLTVSRDQQSVRDPARRTSRTNAPGRVIRLYTVEDFSRRPEHDAPEIARRELSELCLTLRAMGIAHPNTSLAGSTSTGCRGRRAPKICWIVWVLRASAPERWPDIRCIRAWHGW